MSNSITITINRLGPIIDSTLELKPFMVFSGHSGLGKSYTAMLVHYVYKLLTDFSLKEFFISQDKKLNTLKAGLAEPNEGLLFQFALADFEDWVNSSCVAYLGEMLGYSGFTADVQVHFTGMPAKYTYYYKYSVVEMSGEMAYFDTVILNETDTVQLPAGNEWGEIPFVLLLRKLLRNTYEYTLSDTFFLPPSRGAFNGISETGRVQVLANQGMYREFLEDYSKLKAGLIDKQVNPTQVRRYSTLSTSLIEGQLLLKEGELYYQRAEMDQPLPISATASSIKELAPFAFMLQQGVAGQYAILFEEPESHLHPTMQIQVADLLVYLLKEGAYFQITTHSENLLRRLNDLIRLDLLRRKLSEDEYLKFCEENHYRPELTLNPLEVNAYYFKRDTSGKVTVQLQHIDQGIPFDTFRSVLESELVSSSRLYDLLEDNI